MKKGLIRWPGLGLFVVLVVLIGGVSYFLIDPLIKSVIENQGSKVVGAEVDLGSADFSFFPAGLALNRLQITNPDDPLRNIVEIDRLAMSIDPLPLLQRKVIIPEMTAEGIRPDTARKKSGALPATVAAPKPAKAEKEGQGFTMPSLKIPDVKEVLAREDLQTVTLAREFEERIKADKAKWQQRLADLPSEKKLKSYQERLNKLKGSQGLAGLLGGANELLSVKNELQADLDRLKSAQKDFTENQSAYQKRLAELQNAPQRDIKRLLDKYSLSPEGLAHLGSLVFGGKTGSLLAQAVAWYEKAQPLLQRKKEKKGAVEVVKPARGRGVNVRFAEKEPLPGFLIRKISASVQIAAGSFAGTIDNITPDQDVLGKPLTFKFMGDKLQGLREVKFDGVLNHVNPDQPKDSVNLGINGYTLDKMALSTSRSLPVTIAKGQADLTVTAVVRQRQLNGEARASLKSATLTTTRPEDGNAISQALAGALSDISNVSVKAEVTGTLDDYNLQLSSNLDTILKQAAGNAIKTQTARFEQQLKEGVMEKVKGPLADASGSYGDFGGIAQELGSRVQIGSSLL